MRKAARIIFKVEMIVAIVSFAICLIASFVWWGLSVQIAEAINGNGSWNGHPMDSEEAKIFTMIFGVMFIVLTILMVPCIVVTAIGAKVAANAKSKNEVITIGVLNCIFGSKVGAIFLFVSRPREYIENNTAEY